MVRAFKKIFLLACMFFAVLAVMQFVVDSGLKKSKMQNYAVWNDLYQSRINADAIILGGSRAKLIVSPKVIDSVLNLNSYNLGINGGYFPMQEAVLKIYLQHNKKPKYIIQNMDFAMFSNGPHLSNADQFIPYLNDPVIRDMASQYEEKFTIPEIYLPLFKYNNHTNLIKEGILCYFNFGHRAYNNLYKGFGASNTVFDDFFEKRMTREAGFIMNNIDKRLDSEFVSYLNYCKDNNIKVIFYYGPVLEKVNRLMKADTSAVTRKIISYARAYNIPYLSYLDDSICYHKELFTDHIHLNARGSQLFNEKLANDLKKIMTSQEK